MKTKRKLKLIIANLIMMLLIVGNTMIAFAAETVSSETVSYLEQHWGVNCASNVSKYFSSTNNENGTLTPLVIKGGTVTIYYDAANADLINANVQSLTSTEKITDITDGLNISADTDSATTILQPIMPGLSVLIGILVVLMTIAMTLFSALDIMYVTWPVAREKMEQSKDSGGAMAKQTSNGGTKLRFITDDAIYAVTTCTIESGKNPLFTYLGKRCVSYIGLAVVLFILLTGNISLITNLALKIVSGVLQLIVKIGN